MDARTPSGRLGRRIGIAAAAAAALAVLAGCGGEDTAGPERGVTVGEIQQPQYFYEGEYLGRQVTVSAAVADVLGPRSLEIDGADYGDNSLLVMTTEPVAVEVGQVVRATGTVGQYHRLSEHDYPPGAYDLYEKYETEAYLYDAVIELLPAQPMPAALRAGNGA
ncbi:hypothetical protein [Pseudonocardia asaccharolytica]|uniref:hypothetical protein n=1 Tax=Pseudonocardia asaccharolytica TaxID=54010 RepID=UPI00040C804A|nr:hypothetical protein [Pseudonocardia asaccharolytica]